MKVVAEVEIKGILQENPEQLWELTKNYSGVTKEFYNQYYKNKNIAIAYELGKIVKYEKPKDLIDIGINYIPQSFVYMDN